MSHEIRTPINAMIGYTDLLSQGIPDPPTEAQKGYLERIERTSQMLMALVNDVLDFSRIEAGEMRYKRTVAPIAEAIQNAEAVLEPEAHRKGVHLSSRCPDDLGFVGDSQWVQQILLNLLSNAVKFTPAGGRVVVSCESSVAGPRSGSGSWLRVDVRDTGIGIPPDQVSRIFEPFVQAETGYTRKHGGVGLGLAISRRLAELMGGEIRVTSTPGHGSCFTVWLQAEPDREPARA
jgi:signal transduction histidine kinase